MRRPWQYIFFDQINVNYKITLDESAHDIGYGFAKTQILNTLESLRIAVKNNKAIIALCIPLIGCTSLKYPDWEYVRIENQVPSKDCVYKIQEACSLPTNQCLNWHKQRATTYNANTVVISDFKNQAKYSTGVWQASGGDYGSTVAEYYYCSGAKNIKPK